MPVHLYQGLRYWNFWPCSGYLQYQQQCRRQVLTGRIVAKLLIIYQSPTESIIGKILNNYCIFVGRENLTTDYKALK